MGWLITGGILFLLAILPLGVRICYDAAGLMVKVVLGPVKFTVYPLPKREAEDDKKKSRAESEDKKKPEKASGSPKEEEPKEKETGGSVLDFLPLVKLALELLGDFRRKLRVDELYLRLIMAGDDPCDLAVNYGRAMAAAGNLIAQLERLFVIKKRDVEVECDFVASQTLIHARVELTITLGRLLSIAVAYGVRAVKEFLSIQKKRKGGAVQ